MRYTLARGLAVPSGAAGDWTSQVRRGVLELCVLALLSRQPSYGYEIVATLAGWTPCVVEYRSDGMRVGNVIQDHTRSKNDG